MLKVLHCFHCYLPGTQSWLSELLVNLTEQQITNEIAAQHLNLRYFPAREMSTFPFIFKFTDHGLSKINRRLGKLYLQLARRFYPIWLLFKIPDDIKIIHTHFATTGWRYLQLIKTKKRISIVSFYGYDYEMVPASNKFWSWKYKILFDKIDWFICEGSHGAKILENQGCPRHKIKILKLGVDVKNIPFYTRIKKQNSLQLIQIASFKEKKGHIYTLKAFQKALKTSPNMTLTLVGNGTAQMNRKIQNLITALQLDDYVNMVEFVSYKELHPYLSNFDVFIHPSCYADNKDCEGGAPIVLLDAQATGLPVISTVHCDIPEEVLHNKTGILVPEKDIDQLAKAIERFYKFPDIQYQPFSKAARKHVGENYDIKLNAAQFRAFYEKISLTPELE